MINERNLSKPELNKREDIIMNMKKNKRDLVNKYGKDAEAVMYGRATNMAKKQTKEMRDPKLTELIKDALKNPKTKKNIKETLDEEAWAKLNRLRDAIGDDDYIIQSLMKALSTDDANLYLDAMIRDHIDIVQGEEGEESVYGDKTIDETVEDYITSVNDLSETNITESMNMNKWRRAYNGKAFAKKVVYLEDYNGNKKRYVIFFKYKETPSKDIVYLRESQIGKHEGSGMAFAMSNLQNNPTYLFTSDDIMEFDTEEQFDDFVDDGAKGLESLLSFFLGGQNVDKAIKAWFDTGVTDKSKLKIGPAEYLEGAAVNEGNNDVSLSKIFMKGVGQGGEKNPDQLTDEPEKEYFLFLNDLRDSGKTNMFGATPYLQSAFDLEKKEAREILTRWMKSFSESIAEGLPKGFWDKKIDAEDEDQDGKVDEAMAAFSSEEDEDKYIEKMVKQTLEKEKEKANKKKKVGESLETLLSKAKKIQSFVDAQGKKDGYEGGVHSPVGGVLTAMQVAGGPKFDGDDDLKGYYTRKLSKAIDTQLQKKYMKDFIGESYDTLVNKIKKSGKSAKAAKAIAGAVASYKAKGGGKGPTAKQK